MVCTLFQLSSPDKTYISICQDTMTTSLRYNVECSDLLPPHSDKCILPSLLLKEVISLRPELPHPLVLELFGANQTYVGVMEFTAPEGTIVVPQDVFEKLSSKEVEIRVVDLPKCTYLKLKPTQFHPHITNWKYYLESFLSTKYTVLTKNQSFFYDDDVAKTTVEVVVEDCNADAVVVVEANAELDVVPLNDIMATQQLQHGVDLAKLENIPKLDGRIELSLQPFGQVSVQNIFSVDLREQKNQFSIVLETSGDTSNVDVVCGLDKFLTLENFNLCSMSLNSDNQPVKTLFVDLKSDLIQGHLKRTKNDEECLLYIIPFAWDQPCTSTLSLVPGPKVSDELQSPEENGNTKICQNCGKYISTSNFASHEAFCLRNVKRCLCGKRFPKTIPSLHWHCDSCEATGDSVLLKFKHDKLYHQGPYICRACDSKESFASFLDLVLLHKGSNCPRKLHECRFCRLVLPQEEATYEDRFNDLTHHESSCGNKTTECFKCHKSIRNKDLKTHLQLHSFTSEKAIDEVSHCANVNCVNVVGNHSIADNALGLCDTCYGPLYSSDFDSTNIKLQNRIERKYVMQLTRGCGQSWCDNKECASGNVKLDIKLALQHIKNDLFIQIGRPSLPVNKDLSVPPTNKFWFCVNESVSLKKAYLRELMAEKRFEESLIYKALTLKGVEGAREYLVANS